MHHMPSEYITEIYSVKSNESVPKSRLKDILKEIGKTDTNRPTCLYQLSIATSQITSKLNVCKQQIFTILVSKFQNQTCLRSSHSESVQGCNPAVDKDTNISRPDCRDPIPQLLQLVGGCKSSIAVDWFEKTHFQLTCMTASKPQALAVCWPDM